ncbi:MAG: hypothetical protein NWF00_08885 [Candidatus Bathyarchaeota archaeon]|nr:hypothetical protein [Candidatus Bathyarchaeota archaeon]
MTTRKQKLLLSTITAALTLALLLFSTYIPAQAQTETNFGPKDEFAIPELQGTIRFALNGTYKQATLEDGFWNFMDLSINGSTQTSNLKASAQNSDITITEYSNFDESALSNSTIRGLLFRYTVTGEGVQEFNFGSALRSGEWSVLFDEDFIGINEGWTVSADHTLIVTGAKNNVSIFYFNLPESFGDAEDSAKPFYEQHSVAITTAAAVTVVVVLAVVAKKKNEPNGSWQLDKLINQHPKHE